MRRTKKTVPWEVGDAFAVDGTRWKITALNAKTRAVQLEALSTTNHGMRWTTTLDKLPQEGRVMTATVAPEQLSGIVLDLDEETYHAHPALSSTGARQLLDAPARFEYARSVPQEPRKAFDVGTAAHSKVLGAGAPVVAIPGEMLASNGAASTAAAKQFIADARAAGQVPVKQAELDAVNLMAEAVLAHPDARGAFEQDGHPEASVFATDPVFGVEVRCRFDWLAAIGVDLKTSAKKATRAQFERTVMDYGYHIQQAHYEDTYGFAGGSLDGFTFVVVEKEPPHLVGVFVLDADFRQMGRDKAAEARRRFAEGIETGLWPGYPEEIQIVRPPQWAIAAHVKEARVA